MSEKTKYQLAYEWRADKEDIDIKDTGRTKLAYLNWAVAWRKMLEFYPDASYEVVPSSADGCLLWKVGDSAYLRIAVTADGVTRTEFFPIMDYKYEATPYDDIDARDLNDSIQRGLTKCFARFGVGAYIYEGKVDGANKADFYEKKPYARPQPKPAPSAPDANDPDAKLSPEQVKALKHAAMNRGVKTAEQFEKMVGFPVDHEFTRAEGAKALGIIATLPFCGEGDNGK